MMNVLVVMPFKETHKEQIRLVDSFDINSNELEKVSEIVKTVLSSSPYLDKERVEKVTVAAENRARVLGNIINERSQK